MHLETQVALNFLISFLYNKLPRRRVNQFGEELEKALKTKFEGHWYPDKPHKGSAYRCIRCTPPLDPFVFEVAARNSGVSLIDIQENLPQELSIWVDPGEVSYRISEKGPVKILYGEKSDLTSSQCKDIGLNPDARCFKPIEAWPHGQFSNVVENNLTSAAPLNPFVAVKKNNPVTFTTAAFAATKFGSTKLKTQQAKAKSHRSSPTDSNINFIRQKVIPSMTKDNFYNGINKMRGMTELDCEVFHVSAKINANVNNKLSDSMPDWRVMPNSLETSHKAWAFSQVDQTMELSPTTIDNYSPLNQVKHQLAHLCNNKDFCNSNLADPWMETGENTSELETTPFMTDKLWDEILNWNCDKVDSERGVEEGGVAIPGGSGSVARIANGSNGDSARHGSLGGWSVTSDSWPGSHESSPLNLAHEFDTLSLNSSTSSSVASVSSYAN